MKQFDDKLKHIKDPKWKVSTRKTKYFFFISGPSERFSSAAENYLPQNWFLWQWCFYELAWSKEPIKNNNNFFFPIRVRTTVALRHIIVLHIHNVVRARVTHEAYYENNVFLRYNKNKKKKGVPNISNYSKVSRCNLQ